MMLDANAFGMAERLRNHNGYLDSLISMVPAKYYFPPDPEEMAKKFQKHVNKPATQTAADKLQRKIESSERKRAKLDPEQLTVPQQQQHTAEQEEQERAHDRAQQRRRSQQASNGDGDGDDDDDDSGPISAALMGYKTGDASSVSELKARLQQKLEGLRNGRGGVPKAREEREREREETKADKKKRKLNGKPNSGGGGGGGADAAVAAAASAGGSSQGAQPAAPGVGTVFNKVVVPKAEPWKAKRKLSDAQLLAQAEEAAGKLRQRKAEGGSEELGIEVWQKALEKAGGVKQKDDPSLLKKAMKRKERQKKKSAKEWKARLSTTAKGIADKQKARTENLAARGTKGKAKANKRKDIANKRRPGFEGTAKPLN